jgi:multidrug efflux pump subunit AcrA (membrane-fusion protein)
MKSKVLILAAISGLLLQMACGEKKPGEQGNKAQPVPVSIATIQYEPIRSVVEAPGTVQPRSRISLSSQVNGFVREMHVHAGDLVKKDQILATLDARDAQSQKTAALAAISEAEEALSEARKARQAAAGMQAAAKASTELASQTYNRYQKLFESRSISPQELDEVKARRNASAAELASKESMAEAAEDRIKQMEAKVSQAKAQASRTDVLLSWTEIKAPANGRVVQRLADPGTAIFPGTPLLVIESTESPQALVEIPTEQSGILRIGETVRIRDAGSGAASEGRISEIVPQSDPATHSTQFKVDLPPGFPTHSGQFVKVEARAGNRDALLSPKTAIRQTGQLTGLFVVDSASIAHFRLVKIAPYDSERIEVLSGIESGERIISKLSNPIVDGIPVTAR